jgi:hypothetical protein
VTTAVLRAAIKETHCICTNCFNIKPLCTLSIQCNNTQRIRLTTNSNYFSKQHTRVSLRQWYSTWGTRTPGGTRRHLRGYVKLNK